MHRIGTLASALGAAALTACSGSSAPVAPPLPPSDGFGLSYLGTQQIDARLYELKFNTPDLNETAGVRVLLPADYASSGNRYPVLYLLHGSQNDETAWTSAGEGDAETLSAGLPLIVVMPWGGSDGDYSDYYNFGAYGNERWESFHTERLLPWIDAHYRTIASRGGRAVAGLSMGGGGAMKYAARHPQLFGAAASFSGDVDSNYPPLLGTPDIPSSGRLPYAVWGLRATDEVRWRGNNPWDLALNLRGMALFIRSHTGLPGNGELGDPIEAGAYAQSMDLDQQLTVLNIPHLFNDDGPGGHEWPHWNADLKATLPALMQNFRQPVPAPAATSFTTIENQYTAYGWQVRLDRPVLEFSTLGNATTQGFSFTGSGDAVVTTPALFQPGRSFHVGITHGDASITLAIAADGMGRLSIPFTLGPANPYQEYTVQAALAGTKVYRVDVSIRP